MKLLIFLVLSRCGLAFKYRVIFQISSYLNAELNFLIFLVFHFIFLITHYNSEAISTCYDKSDGLSHDELRTVSSAQIAILHTASLGRQ